MTRIIIELDENGKNFHSFMEDLTYLLIDENINNSLYKACIIMSNGERGRIDGPLSSKIKDKNTISEVPILEKSIKCLYDKISKCFDTGKNLSEVEDFIAIYESMKDDLNNING